LDEEGDKSPTTSNASGFGLGFLDEEGDKSPTTNKLLTTTGLS